MNWATTFCPDAAFMNIESDAQKQHLLFAPVKNRKTRKMMEAVRTFEAPNTVGYIEPGKTKALKKIYFTLKGIGFKGSDYTSSGWPAVSATALKELAGDPAKGKFGTAYNHYKVLINYFYIIFFYFFKIFYYFYV